MATRNQQPEHFPHGHGHQLQLMKVPAGAATYSFNCDGCKERGFGNRYRCDACNFDLHEECHHPPLTLQSHHFPKEFTFKFLPAPTTSSSCFCVACGKGVFGFVYQYSCKDKDSKPELYLHPCCTNQKLHFRFKGADLYLKDEVVPHDPELGTKPCFYCKKIALSGQEQGWSYLSKYPPVVYRIHVYCSMEMEMESKHPADDQYCPHGHQLKLINGPIINGKRKFFNCDGCKEGGFGHRYRCDTCDFDLHKECYQPSLTIQNSNFPGHTFDFLPKLSPTNSPSRFCDACGKKVKGYVYHCKDRGWDLHPCCSNLPPSIQFSDGSELFLQEAEIAAAPHDHVQLVGSKKTEACFRCKNTTLSETIKGVPGWSYVSKCGVYRCHVYCTMKRCREILRSRETARFATAPISRRNGRGRNSTEDWWELASTITEFISGDPNSIIIESIIESMSNF